MTKILTAVAIVGAALAAAATAAAPITVSLAASPAVVSYGKPVTLSGTLSTQKANQAIAIQATECGSARATRAATIKTVTNGAYAGPVTPALGTSYQATFKNAAKSTAVAVAVRPVLELTRVKRNSYA